MTDDGRIHYFIGIEATRMKNWQAVAKYIEIRAPLKIRRSHMGGIRPDHCAGFTSYVGAIQWSFFNAFISLRKLKEARII